MLAISCVAIVLLSGCNDSKSKQQSPENNTTAQVKKITYGSKVDLDTTGMQANELNIDCQGKLAKNAVENNVIQNSPSNVDWKVTDYTMIKKDAISSECQVRSIMIEKVQGIFGQQKLSYKISNENGKYSIAFQDINGTVQPDNAVALNHSCSSSNAKILIDYFIGSEYSMQTGVEPSIEINNIVTEKNTNNSSTCNAAIKVNNPDPNAPDSDAVLASYNLHYQIMVTDDKKSVLYKKL